MTKTHIIMQTNWGLGDTVVLSAVPRDIHLAHPGRFAIYPRGGHMAIFDRNPYVETGTPPSTARHWPVTYRQGWQRAQRGHRAHFMTWFGTQFSTLFGAQVPLTRPHGDLYLSEKERAVSAGGRYWLLIAGGKMDITTKWWHPKRWQALANALSDRGVRCVQAGQRFSGNRHWKLQGVESWVDQTPDTRDFCGLIANAEGVICGVTGAMHIAACFDRPCVVLGGGREEPWWEGYNHEFNQFPSSCARVAVPHRYLHTIGRLACCDKAGCWRAHTYGSRLPAGQTRPPSNVCLKPVMGEHPYPKCMEMIEVPQVVESVMSYYEDRTLEPVGQPSTRISVPVVRPPAPPPLPVSPSKLDHPILGGRMTIFVLLYGDYLQLASRCIDSILRTVPADRLDLRVGLNAVGVRTAAYVEQLGAQISHRYENPGPVALKYPMMRRMFRDQENPVTTPYLCWFDDDSWCRDNDWLDKLAALIIDQHNQGFRLYGPRFFSDMRQTLTKKHDGLKWFRDAPWWRQKDLYLSDRRATAPNGTGCFMASGGFWALHTETMIKGDIPDRRLEHRGGDITIGYQVHQLGGRVCEFSPKSTKRPICWSDHKRRGANQAFPWLPAGSPDAL